ncbi:hypothetical protein [Antarcticirhabdus aurantiaca]|uniref:Uncharacterized protein n=1 Tax=Antarcticirhabdus aurantiaca TaxID=2606717 RepID=A0ACD4NKS4_9HYPH|nr:hypothetical protein [Antarcticirhabdus aurantiaca]WAJ27403.1 hypothetical protein OXU80_21535 [Jeongeuplla avenae]
MIPPVPYAIRLPLALVVISSAVVLRASANAVSDVLGALARWIVPEHEARTR